MESWLFRRLDGESSSDGEGACGFVDDGYGAFVMDPCQRWLQKAALAWRCWLDCWFSTRDDTSSMRTKSLASSHRTEVSRVRVP